MEKKKPHYPLAQVKALLLERRVRATHSAIAGAAALGVDFAEMLDVVRMLEPGDFYKSMTTHADHTAWQDVYHARTTFGAVYLKLMVPDDLLIVSFKEL